MTQPEPDLVPTLAYERAELGDVLQDSDTCPVPDGWHLMDGLKLISYEWPDFVAKMGIKGGQFTLPAPQRTIPGHHWIIKVGQRRPWPTRPGAARG